MEFKGLCLCLLVVWVESVPPHCDHQAAIYKVVFQAEWTEAKFPKHYPKWRPNAQWSTLVGRSHSSSYRLWKSGSISSDAVKLFSETGKTDFLVTEAQGIHGLLDEFYGPPITQGQGTSQTQFMVDSNHSKVSLMCRIVPSPDWFVGVDSVQLCSEEHRGWIQNAVFDLDPMDAGTDNGFTFTAPNWDTEPRAKLTRITSQQPSHPANSFYYPHLKKLPRMGQMTFSLVKVFYQRENQEISNDSEETLVRTLIAGEIIPSPRLRHRKHKGYEQTLETEVEFATHSQKQLEGNSSLKRILQSDAVATTTFEVVKSNKAKEEEHLDTNRVDANKSKVNQLRRKINRKHSKRPPRPCRVSEWSDWSPCSKTCGFGESFRTKSILKSAQPGGQPCPPLRETRWCGSTRNCRTPSGYFVW